MAIKSFIPAILGVGAIGGTAGLGYWCSLPKDVKGVLIREDIMLLNTRGHEEQWQKLAKKHTNEAEITLKNNVKVKTIDGLGNISTGNNIQKLKDKCEELLKEPISEDNKFKTAKQNAKDWCSFASPILKEENIEATTPSLVLRGAFQQK